jgi:hypothetical protein
MISVGNGAGWSVARERPVGPIAGDTGICDVGAHSSARHLAAREEFGVGAIGVPRQPGLLEVERTVGFVSECRSHDRCVLTRANPS